MSSWTGHLLERERAGYERLCRRVTGAAVLTDGLVDMDVDLLVDR